MQCVVYPQVTQVSPVIKRALSRRNPGPAGNARDLDLLPGEEIGGEDSLRGDGHPAHRRLPGLAIAAQGCNLNPGHGAPGLLLPARIDALGRRLAHRPPDRDNVRLLTQDDAQIVG